MTAVSRAGGSRAAIERPIVEIERRHGAQLIVAIAGPRCGADRAATACTPNTTTGGHASRPRIIEATETERRRIERNLHDGAAAARALRIR